MAIPILLSARANPVPVGFLRNFAISSIIVIGVGVQGSFASSVQIQRFLKTTLALNASI